MHRARAQAASPDNQRMQPPAHTCVAGGDAAAGVIRVHASRVSSSLECESTERGGAGVVCRSRAVGTLTETAHECPGHCSGRGGRGGWACRGGRGTGMCASTLSRSLRTHTSRGGTGREEPTTHACLRPITVRVTAGCACAACMHAGCCCCPLVHACTDRPCCAPSDPSHSHQRARIGGVSR